MNSAESLKKLLNESGIDPGSDRGSRMCAFLMLLEKWNARINLTGSTEWRVLGPMFREGLWAGGFYPASAATHLDIGSGAGFPALLLKILHPRILLELVESREKKCQFLATAAHHLGLEGVEVRNVRLSAYLKSRDAGTRWDCVSWKALKLATGDLHLLRERADEETRFWMFHGREPALQEAEGVQAGFQLVSREAIPGTRDSHLSIYRKE